LAVAKCNGIPEGEKVTTAYSVVPAEAADSATGLVARVGRNEWGDTDPRRADELVRAADHDDASERVEAADVIARALQEGGPRTAQQLVELRKE
jgi:hypothetical protein